MDLYMQINDYDVGGLIIGVLMCREYDVTRTDLRRGSRIKMFNLINSSFQAHIHFNFLFLYFSILLGQ